MSSITAKNIFYGVICLAIVAGIVYLTTLIPDVWIKFGKAWQETTWSSFPDILNIFFWSIALLLIGIALPAIEVLVIISAILIFLFWFFFKDVLKPLVDLLNETTDY